MMKITIDMVMDCELCEDYSREVIEELAEGRDSISAAEVAALPIPIYDRAWLLSKLLGPRDTRREVARRITREALAGRAVPPEYLKWLDSGAEDLRDDALEGLKHVTNYTWYAARDAASRVAKSAALTTAWYTARNHDTEEIRTAAMEKYLSWMAEWLDSHG